MFVMCEISTWILSLVVNMNKQASELTAVLISIKIKKCSIYNLLHFHCGFKAQKFHSVTGGEGCHNNATIHTKANE